MNENITELWRIVESLQLELTSLRNNVTSSGIDASVAASQVDSMATDMDSFWLMLGSILIVFMQAGFAMLEVGCVGTKHTKDILIKNMLDMAVAAMVWWSCGWAVAYGGESESGKFNQFAGPGSFFTRGELFSDATGKYSTEQGYNWALWLFQMSFSGAAVTIVSGAVGTRITMTGYIMFSLVMGGFIYPVVARWGWNTFGWASAFSDDPLFGCGALDFAGTGVVHTTGGVAALVMVILTGPFLDRASELSGPGYTEDQKIVTQTLGAFILWVGWYGFNGCSTLYITGSSHVAAKAMVCTTISAAGAGLGVTSASLVQYQHAGPSEIINGLISGLVAISGCCAVVEVEGAFFIGLVSAVNYLAFSRFLELVNIDDMVDAAAVHLANGVWGMVAGGLFASEEGYSAAYYADRSQQCCGWLYGCGTAQLRANVCFLAALMGWAGFTTLLTGSALKRLRVLRVSKSEERSGMGTVAVKSTEMTEIALKVLRRIEVWAANLGYDLDDQMESTNSPPISRRKAVVSSNSPTSGGKQTRTVLVAPSRPSESPDPAENKEGPASSGELADTSGATNPSGDNPSRPRKRGFWWRGGSDENTKVAAVVSTFVENAAQTRAKKAASHIASQSGKVPTRAASPKTVVTLLPPVRAFTATGGSDKNMQDGITPFVTPHAPTTNASAPSTVRDSGDNRP